MGPEVADPQRNTRYTLTRTEVAVRLGLSTSSVRRLEGSQLHPAQDDRGVWRFDSVEVDHLPHRKLPVRKPRGRRKPPSAGEVPARVFRQLDAGGELIDIVIATRQSPSLMRHREWLTSLKQGERDRPTRERNRLAREAHDRERREHVEDDRAHLEWTKVWNR